MRRKRERKEMMMKKKKPKKKTSQRLRIKGRALKKLRSNRRQKLTGER